MYDDSETLKIVLIGESGVGKTSIISQFIDQTFTQDNQTTLGGTFSTKEIKCGQRILKIEVWDTAGQERYRSVAKMFYKDANAALLVYDITSKYTYEELKYYWMEQVKENSPKSTILAVVANKSDLIEKEQVDEGEARKFATDNNALFASTSAKNSAGIEKLFMDIAKKYTGSESARVLAEEEEYRAMRKASVKISMYSIGKAPKKEGCC